MQTLDFKVSKRNELGKKSTKALRKKGLVPCVLYGGGENIHFSASAKEMKKILNTPKTFLLNLDIDGKVYNAFLQDSQFHPVSDEVLHIDFKQIFDDKPIKISIPVRLEGFAEGVKAGGILIQAKRYLRVSALAKDLPNELVVDVTPLTIGDSIKTSSLSFENLEIIEPASSIVAAVKLTRTATMMEDEEEEDEEGEEGEASEETEEKSE